MIIENESIPFFEQDNKKYRNDNGLARGDKKPSKILKENYVKFEKILSSFSIYDKLEDITKKFDIFAENNDDEDKKNKIDLEIDDIIEKYNGIVKEAEENKLYYGKVIKCLLTEYEFHYWAKDSKKILDKTTNEIIQLLNKNYIQYEKNLINILEKLKNLNLKLTNIIN